MNQLGVYDDAGHSLVNSHDVVLFQIDSLGANPTATPLGSVTVGAGTSSSSDFVFQSLSSPISLAAGNYAVIAYDMNASGGDPYGDKGGVPDGITTPNVTDYRFDPYQFTGAGANPAFPNAGDGNIHASAAFTYSTPEPSSLALLTLASAGLLRRRRAN